MSKQLNIDLNFNANTAQAQQQIQQLQHSLSQIAAAGTVGAGGEKITTQLKQASAAAKELQMHLSAAMNTQTGKLDLNKLNNSLLSTKSNLSSLSTALLQTGSTGTTAFTQLATAVSQADRPMLALNGKLTQLWTVMKNTARWQLSSSMLHGFISGVSEAYRYAQDLNESLNNIRIVTGHSAAYMEDFAIQANKAAKALSTTTNEYAKASLIYFQQGLSAEEVNKRAAVTIKMANVSRQSAEVVSDQMTAVWNNFYDGSKSLEYYADVMTALGAKTASSSDEIAGGLEKFAAIGDTIGLSYEYAASALATITANTRQSEEVVGTALKTIFARIQGLKLGETLEDGVELNKYSEALATIGVDIFDANKNLKDMDVILDETAAKWDILTQAQKTATAQTVAGIRQYNQFIALMDNWNDGTSDSMVANLETSYGATGTLEQQANTYAESWEAARDRVTVSAEAIYNALLDDDVFIGLNDMLSGLLDSLNAFIDGIGGLKSVMLGAFTLISSAMASRLQPMINNILANFQVMFQGAAKSAMALGDQMNGLIVQAQQNTNINLSMSQNQELINANNLIVAKNKLSSVNKGLSDSERFLAESSLNIIQTEQEKAVAIAQTIEKLQEEQAILQQQFMQESNTNKMVSRMMSPVDKTFNQLENQKMQAVATGDGAQITQINSQLNALNKQYENIEFSANSAARAMTQSFVTALERGGNELIEGNALFKEYIANLTEFANKNVSHMTSPESLTNARMVVAEYVNSLPEAVTKTEEFQKALTALGRAKTGETTKKAILNIVEAMDKAKFSTKDLEKMLRQLDQDANVDKIKKNIDDLNNKEKDLLKTQNQINNAIKNFNPAHKFTGIEKITAFGSALSSVAMTYNMLKSAVTAWKNPDISFGEKLMTTFMSLGMMIPMVTNGFSNILKMMGLMNAAEIKNIVTITASIIIRKGLITALNAEEAEYYQLYIAKRMSEGATREEIKTELVSMGIKGGMKTAIQLLRGEKTLDTLQTTLNTAAEKGNVLAKMANWAITKLQDIANGKLVVGKVGSTIATWAETAANWALNASMAPLLIIIGLIVAALASLALIIWGAVTAIKAMTDAYNEDAIAAEKANKALQEQKTILDEVTAKHNELLDAISKYETAYDTLQKMTRGTEEWKEQVEALNKSVIDLITTYPELAEHVDDIDGVLTIDEKEVDKVKSLSNQKVREQQANVYAAQRQANIANKKNEINNMSRSNNKDGWAIVGENLIAGTTLGATMGAAFEGIGAIPGAILGAAYGLGESIKDLYNQDSRSQYIEDQINALVEAYEERGEEIFLEDAVKEKMDYITTALGEDEAAILELVRSTNALNETNKILAGQEVDSLLADNKEYQDSKYQDVIREKLSEDVVENAEVTQAHRDKAEANLKTGSKPEDYTDFLKASFGANYDPSKQRVVNAKGDNFTVEVKNEETGQWEVANKNGKRNTISNKDMIDTTAQYYANQEAKDKVKSFDVGRYNDVLTEIETSLYDMGLESGEAIEEAVSNFALDKEIDLSKFSEKDLNKIREQQQAYNEASQFREGESSLEYQQRMSNFSGGPGILGNKIEEFDANGGTLGAKIEQFQRIYQEGQKYNDMLQQLEGAERAFSSGMIDENQLNMFRQKEEYARAALQVTKEEQEYYNSLSEGQQNLLKEIDLSNVDVTNVEQFKADIQAKLDEAMELEIAARIAPEAEEFGLDPEEIQDIAEAFHDMGEAGEEGFEGLGEDSEEAAEAAKDAAVRYKRLNNAVIDLSENYDEYKDVLGDLKSASNDVDKAVVKNSDSYKKLKTSLAGLLGTTEDFIDADLMEAIDPKDLQKAAEGDEAAIERIRDSFIRLQAEAAGIDFNGLKSELNDLFANANELGQISIDADTSPLLWSLLQAKIAAGASAGEIEALLSGFNIDADVEPFFGDCNAAQQAAIDTGDTVTKYLSYDSEVETVNAESTTQGNQVEFTESFTEVPQTVTSETLETDENGETVKDTITYTVKGVKKTVEPVSETLPEEKETTTGTSVNVTNKGGQSGGATGVKISNARKSAGNYVSPSTKRQSSGNNPGGSGGNGGSGGSGGGSSKPAKKSRLTRKKDTVERYKELNDQLKLVQDSVEDISREMDNAWGPDRIKLMNQYQKELSKEIALQKKIREQIKATIWEDQQAIKDFMKEMPDGDIGGLGDLGLSFEFDDNTLAITNYDEIMSFLHAKLNEYEAVKNSLATEEEQSAYEESTLAPFKEKIDYVKDLISTYDETVDAFIEKNNEIEEKINEKMQSNFDELQYKIEIDVQINEQDLENLEHVLERFSDNDPFVTAERIAIISQKAIEYRQIADAQLEGMREAERLYSLYLSGDKENGISKQAYMEKIQEAKEAIMEAENSIREGIEATREELENAFDLADERLDRHFEKFDQLLEVMEHYKNVVSLVEGETSYENLNELLKASQQVLRDRIEADKSEIAMWEGRRAQLEAQIATLPQDSPAKREAEEALQVIMEKEAEAKSQLMADIEQLGEYAREIFENSIEQAMKDFEDEMFGRPLNSIIESIEMMNSRQEELLTTTNKIYETNKLIRNVEKDIEATTNNRAKQAFAEFQNKVKQKQEQNELTKFELDLLTAEYEMTKAQIALEEAQNAKDTVRLTRDAEGNYGYVYTANEDKVADAEQALDDATNNYYNTALEGAQKYQDQIYQHIQEWEEKVKEVYLDQTLSEEEKNKKIKEINDTYNTLITQDKNLYYMAVGAMQESAYNTQVDYDLKGIKSAKKWFVECDGFLSDLEDAQDEYDRNTEEVSDHTEENFGRMSTAIRETKQESEYLKDQIVDELVPELNTTLKDSIDKATEAWQKYIEALQEVIRLSDNMMKKQHDTNLKENYRDDYAAQIQQLLDNGASYSDYDIQRLLEFRWEKMGGVDNTDYSALIETGGTASEMRLWEVLRKFKVEQTDWSAYREANPNATWTDAVRAEKLDQDYAQLIYDYLASSPYGRWNDSQVQKYLAERQVKIDENNLAGQAISNEKLKEKIAKKLKKKPEELLTGGYTGDWGPEGRLAVLHEKELVLNKQDTENFLSATNILREISQMLDRDALVASLGAINLRAMTLNSPADQVLQQEVTIHADFPNVTDHNEIEIAIDNLINAASQHAYRT